jgi:hypothetical protein
LLQVLHHTLIHAACPSHNSRKGSLVELQGGLKNHSGLGAGHAGHALLL